MSGTAQRLKHAARIESQKHGHFLTLFRRSTLPDDRWIANCMKCGNPVVVDINTKAAHPLTKQCDERRMR